MNQFSNQEGLPKMIMIATVAIIALMILFPPKVIATRNPLLDQTTTQPAGYTFIFSDPSAEQKANARILMGDEVDKYIGSHIEWGKLFIQLVIVGGAGYALSRFMSQKARA